MPTNLLRSALGIVLAFAAQHSAHAQNLSVDYTALCGGSATVTLDIQEACAAARIALVRNVTQQSGNTVEQSTLATQSSLTAAYIDQLGKLRAAMAPNSTTLAAIRPGTVTTPDMDATIYAELIAATSAAAISATQVISSSITGICTAVLLHDNTLGSIIRGRKTAIAAVELLGEAIDRHSRTLATLPKPQKPVASATDLKLFLESKSLSSLAAAVAPATLLLDLVSNASALIASFRPTISSDSTTVTANFEKRAAVAFTSALIERKVNVMSFDAVLGSAAPAGQDTVVSKVDVLTKATKSLFDDMLAAAQHNYVVADAPPNASEAEKKRIAEAQAVGKKNHDTRQKLVEDARKLIEASDSLRRSILTDTTGADGKLVAQAPIHDFNRLEALLQTSGGKMCTLKIDAADGIADRFAKQRAFGSPDFHARAVGTMPWQLLDSTGRLIAGGNLVADSGWKPFGPTGKRASSN